MNAPYPAVRLKNAWKSTHPWIFQNLVEKPAQRPKPGTIVDVDRRRGRLDRPRLLQRPLAHRPAHPRNRPGRRGRRRLVRAQDRRGRVAAPRRAQARRGHRRLARRPLRGRRPVRPGRRPLRRPAGGRVLQRRHVPPPRVDLRRAARRSSRAAASTASPTSTCRSRSPSTSAAPSRVQPAVITEYGVQVPRRPGRRAQDRLLRRPARQPRVAVAAGRRQARARPVLQHRRLRRVRGGARRRAK